MDPVVELLDRQADFILGLDKDADFLAQVEPFLGVLQSEPRLAVHLRDLGSELVDDVRVLQQVDEELTPELIRLRQELVELAPELDDSDAELPQTGVLDMSAEYTLAFFDHVVAEPAEQMNVAGEGGKGETLLGILKGKDVHHIQEQRQARKAASEAAAGAPPSAEEVESEADDPQELREWRWRLGNIDQRLTHAKRWLALRMRTSAGLAYGRLKQIPEQLNPEPYLIASRQDLLDRLNEGLKKWGSPGPALYKAVGGERLDGVEASLAAEHVEEARRWVRRLHQELRHRLGTTRSRRALIERFKLRCEWHDRARLAGVADDESLPGGARGPPDRGAGPVPLRPGALAADEADDRRPPAGPARPSAARVLRGGEAVQVQRPRGCRQVRRPSPRHRRSPSVARTRWAKRSSSFSVGVVRATRCLRHWKLTGTASIWCWSTSRHRRSRAPARTRGQWSSSRRISLRPQKTPGMVPGGDAEDGDGKP